MRLEIGFRIKNPYVFAERLLIMWPSLPRPQMVPGWRAITQGQTSVPVGLGDSAHKPVLNTRKEVINSESETHGPACRSGVLSAWSGKLMVHRTDHPRGFL